MEEAEARRPQFGSRYLTEEEDVFDHNAWDDVEWNEEQETAAREKVQENSREFLDPELAKNYDSLGSEYWNCFYQKHNAAFFKDRNWLFTEFPVLARWKSDSDSDSNFSVLEVGCGAGNTVFPLLEANKSEKFSVYCCDYSSEAVDLVKKNENFEPERCFPFVWDVTSCESAGIPIAENSLDVVLMIFVLSAIDPSKMQNAIRNVVKYLKPSGLLLFRDYGRYDLAQLRFKKGKCISDNFYVRGDGTRVYFFTQEELDAVFGEAGLTKEINRVDRRLQVNRFKKLKMYRIWIQCDYRKNA